MVFLIYQHCLQSPEFSLVGSVQEWILFYYFYYYYYLRFSFPRFPFNSLFQSLLLGRPFYSYRSLTTCFPSLCLDRLNWILNTSRSLFVCCRAQAFKLIPNYLLDFRVSVVNSLFPLPLWLWVFSFLSSVLFFRSC